MCQLVWRSGCLRETPAPRLEPRRRRGRRATKRSATQRLARRTSRGDQILDRGLASGVAGDRGGVLAGAAGQDAKRAAFTRSGKALKPAISGHWRGPRRQDPGEAG